MDNFYLEGQIYHMVLFSNLESILRRQAILSKEKVLSENIKYTSIAEESVQGLRDRISMWDFLEKRWRSVHSYVPFYFAKLTPMLFKRKEMQHDIVFFDVSRLILRDSGVIFTDGTVAMQCLANPGTETVRITPATSPESSCRRKYLPYGPLGTNSNYSDVYADLGFLKNLNWQVINDRWFNDSTEKKRMKQAEVLVPDYVPLSKVEGISTMTQEKADAANILIKQYALQGRIPKAVPRRDLYF